MLYSNFGKGALLRVFRREIVRVQVVCDHGGTRFVESLEVGDNSLKRSERFSSFQVSDMLADEDVRAH